MKQRLAGHAFRNAEGRVWIIMRRTLRLPAFTHAAHRVAAVTKAFHQAVNWHAHRCACVSESFLPIASAAQRPRRQVHGRLNVGAALAGGLERLDQREHGTTASASDAFAWTELVGVVAVKFLLQPAVDLVLVSLIQSRDLVGFVDHIRLWLSRIGRRRRAIALNDFRLRRTFAA
jgi:hypothetical protein